MQAPPSDDGQRLDKWLWFARVVKSRTLAAELVVLGKVRVNRVRAVKASQTLRPGDVVTLVLAGRVLILKVLAPGVRRGPATEARRLYQPLSSPLASPLASPLDEATGGEREGGSTGGRRV
jgi:ribosome-associated heat shock protein Hsp15